MISAVGEVSLNEARRLQALEPPGREVWISDYGYKQTLHAFDDKKGLSGAVLHRS